MTLEELINSLDDHVLDSTDKPDDRWEKIAVWQDKVNGVLREVFEILQNMEEPE